MSKIFEVFLCLFVVGFRFGNGSVEKEEVGIFELKKGDVSLKVTNWGASIVSLVLPDKKGMNFFFVFILMFVECCLSCLYNVLIFVCFCLWFVFRKIGWCYSWIWFN